MPPAPQRKLRYLLGSLCTISYCCGLWKLCDWPVASKRHSRAPCTEPNTILGKRMAGIVSFDALKKLVSAGDIDTVLTCAVDMQGRLIGKRFLAKYFVESAYEETHGCNYLLANDIDMEPVPGYKAASWT